MRPILYCFQWESNLLLLFGTKCPALYGNGSFRPWVVSVPSRFGPGSFRPESFRPWVVSANLRGSFRPDFFHNPRLFTVTGRFAPGSFRFRVVSARGRFGLSRLGPGSFRPIYVGRFGLIFSQP